LGHKTLKEYDAAGNLIALTDPAERITKYTYDAANRLSEVSYSDGKTPAVIYEYDADNNRTKMIDGTGTTTYGYDVLDRLSETKDGHGNTAGYEYDLANEQTKITYPNGKAVTQAYDKASRLERVTDWLEHATNFKYDADSNPTKTAFPTGTSNEDINSYNNADQLTKTEMKKSTEVLASITYTRDNDGQLKTATQKSLPGEEKPSYTYDESNRLTKVGTTEYKYDAADNPTKTGTSTNTFNEGDEQEKGTGVTYGYDESGERRKRTPTTGPVTTYGYDQAGNLTAVTRPKEGETTEINDSYAYNGDSLRASQTVAGTTTYMAWDESKELPLLLSDTANSYIYGPSGLPIEQISSGGTVGYLHHDQQGSTRLLTGSTGAKEATLTYDGYGNTAGTTGTAKTPLGYDGQYTSTDTGLIYLRARTYDPATGQFLSTDPLKAVTQEPYSFAGDSPTNEVDPTGLLFGIPGTPSWSELGTRVVGFWDGFTRPAFGGTAALRSWLGLNGGLDKCSAEYKVASAIGNTDVSLEAGAAGGGLAEAGIGAGLGGLRVGVVRLGPVIAPVLGGTVGGILQSYVAGNTPTFATGGRGAIGGLLGELATGFFPVRNASGVSGAVSSAVGFAW
jgi:RHS repeat-associated protein